MPLSVPNPAQPQEDWTKLVRVRSGLSTAGSWGMGAASLQFRQRRMQETISTSDTTRRLSRSVSPEIGEPGLGDLVAQLLIGQSSGGFSATSQLQLREALPQSIHMFDGNGVPIIHAQVVLPAEGAGCELLEWLQAFEPTIRSSELKVFARIFHLRHSAEGTGQNRGLCTFHQGGWT